MSDLQGRRAIIMGMNSEKGYEKLLAKVPLKEMSSYSTSLSSITGGRASFTMKFSSYELVPSDVGQAVKSLRGNSGRRLIWIFYKLYEGCPCEGVAFIVFSYGCCNAVI